MSASLRDLAQRVDGLPSTYFDATDLMRRGQARLRRRRIAAVAGATVAVVAVVGAALLAAPGTRDAAPPAEEGHWVLVTGNDVGGADNPVQPAGDEWAEPLGDRGVQSYPRFRSADPATQRFLVQNQEATGWIVMRPGRREPLATIQTDFGAVLGPGPDEVTTPSSDLERMLVLGPDGLTRRSVGAAWTPPPTAGGFTGPFAWSADGETLAETRYEHRAKKGSMTIVLRDPDSPDESTLYEYSEPAPAWYDAEEHRFADGPTAFNDWGAPRLVDLRWAPDSARLAFATMTTPEGGADRRQVRWQLFVADTATGETLRIADLGRCAEPVDERGGYSRVCEGQAVSLAWAPGGERLTVLSDGSLTAYDLTGTVLDSEPTTIEGPIVWMRSGS